MIAYAWATGRIDFGRKMPDGALLIASAPAKKLRGVISVTARHAYDGKTRLVPGVPEAASGNEAVDALLAYNRSVKKRLEVKHGT